MSYTIKIYTAQYMYCIEEHASHIFVNEYVEKVAQINTVYKAVLYIISRAAATAPYKITIYFRRMISFSYATDFLFVLFILFSFFLSLLNFVSCYRYVLWQSNIHISLFISTPEPKKEWNSYHRLDDDHRNITTFTDTTGRML